MKIFTKKHDSQSNKYALGAILILANVIFIIYVNIPFAQEYIYVSEPLLLFLISVCTLIYFFKTKTLVAITYFELIYLIFIFYILLQNVICTRTYNYNAYLSIWFLCLYFSIKALIIDNQTKALRVIFLSIVVVLAVYLIAYSCHLKQTIDSFYLPNKSIFSILLAAQLSFLLPFLFTANKKNNTNPYYIYFLFTLMFCCLALLVLTDGRSGWIGFATALFYTIYQYIQKDKWRKILVSSACIVLVISLPFLIWYKAASSNGRLLIYKISFNILKDNWIWGIGNGQFKTMYNHYQAAYFTINSIDSKEALLADNTYYAFNDFFQLIIENGAVGFLFFSATLTVLFTQIKKNAAFTNKGFIAATASLICICTCSLFSYPFQILPVTIQALLCGVLINFYSKSHTIVLSQSISKGFKYVMVFICLISSMHSFVWMYYKIQSQEAFELSRMGFKKQALKKYEQINSLYVKDGNTIYQYATTLYNSNKLIEANNVISEATNYLVNNDSYRLKAQIAYELKEDKQAEKYFKLAVYIVPNRMKSRYDLLNYYTEIKDTSHAIYWAASILNMPVKVPSKTTYLLQQKTKAILLGLQSSHKDIPISFSPHTPSKPPANNPSQH